MSLLQQLKFPRVKSLYFAVFLAMVTTLSLSFLVFRTISDRLQRKHFDPVYDRLDELQLETATRIFHTEGPKALSNYLTRLDHISGARHFLLDAHGVDLLTGDNKAWLLPPPPSTKWRIRDGGQSFASQRSEDGLYWFAATGKPSRIQIWTFLPYYFLVIGATGLLCWLASVAVVSPIHRIAASIALFGQGKLSVRVHTKRQDEIGQLSNSFNQMAERLQRMIASERRLLADISHELRSPLARLKFAVKLARTSPDPDVAMDRISRDVDRIAALVAGIVEITLAEGDPEVQGAESIRLTEVLDEVIRDCAFEAQVRGCAIALSGCSTGEILGNRELLRRAIENVLRNAIRYSPERSTIDVYLNDDSDAANIAIRDCGPGVPEDMLTRIFDPFFRVEEARDALGGGSGIGLSIAKRAVQVHHGAISAENASPGLRVRIRIPIFQTTTAPPVQQPSSLPSPQFTGLKNS
jgi:signal transduction histidine kinase